MALLESRNDLHLTATGIGHDFRDSLQFPPANFERSVLKSLPSPLLERNVTEHFKTTTGSTHNYKPNDTRLSNDIHKKSAGHWKVGYVEDVIKKLQVKPWRKPLTMGNQSSEMKAQFTGKTGVSLSRHFSNDLQPSVYRHHNDEGPLKNLVPSTQNPELAGQKYFVSDRGILSYHSDMYLTTTQKNHRAFGKNELCKYPKKQYATFWECENYPKAWGHGSNENPLVRPLVARKQEPMRDQIWFKTATVVPRIPKSMTPVPNKGMRSEVMANYTMPNEEKRNELFTCPVPQPPAPEAPGREEIFSIPKMYEIESQYYGSRIPVKI
eukprot:gene18208-20026_t